MTHRNELHSFKTIAKRLARTKRIAHHEALDFIADKLGQPHWNALTAAWEQGWRPEPVQVKSLVTYSKAAYPDRRPIGPIGIGGATEEKGSLDGHPYSIEIDFEVLMGGRGWSICVEQAPSEKPLIEAYNDDKDNPILNPAFVSKALAICDAAAEKLRARIAADWPRRSTKPDAQGRAQHPLFGGLSSDWYCYHCDGTFSGTQMAANMWHCPKCSATPIDIHPGRSWESVS